MDLRWNILGALLYLSMICNSFLVELFLELNHNLIPFDTWLLVLFDRLLVAKKLKGYPPEIDQVISFCIVCLLVHVDQRLLTTPKWNINSECIMFENIRNLIENWAALLLQIPVLSSQVGNIQYHLNRSNTTIKVIR